MAGGSSQFSERAPETYAYAADNGAVISQNSWTLGVTGKLPYSYEQAFTYFNENAGMDDTDGDGVNDVQTGRWRAESSSSQRQCRRSDASARCERQGDSGGRIGSEL